MLLYFLLIFITHQLSYDTQFKDYERIHLLEQVTPSGANTFRDNSVPSDKIDRLLLNLPDIEQHATLERGRITYTGDNGQSVSQLIQYTQSSFFQIFDLRFLEGRREDAVLHANDIVLNASDAKKHFGNAPHWVKP